MVGELEKRLVQGLLKRLPKLSFADDLVVRNKNAGLFGREH